MRSVSALSATGNGYSAVQNIELSIDGITCAACAARIEKKLNAIGPEVIAAVNFATGRAMITARAFGYNIAAVPLAALGFLNPLIAAAAMTMSSVLVVANSLRRRRFRAGPARGVDRGPDQAYPG